MLAYKRTHGDSQALVLLNFSDSAAKVEVESGTWQFVLGNYAIEEGAAYELKPYEGRLYVAH